MGHWSRKKLEKAQRAASANYSDDMKVCREPAGSQPAQQNFKALSTQEVLSSVFFSPLFHACLKEQICLYFHQCNCLHRHVTMTHSVIVTLSFLSCMCVTAVLVCWGLRATYTHYCAWMSLCRHTDDWSCSVKVLLTFTLNVNSSVSSLYQGWLSRYSGLSIDRRVGGLIPKSSLSIRPAPCMVACCD